MAKAKTTAGGDSNSSCRDCRAPLRTSYEREVLDRCTFCAQQAYIDGERPDRIRTLDEVFSNDNIATVH